MEIFKSWFKKNYFRQLILILSLSFLVFESSYGQSIWTNPITGTNPGLASPYTTGDVKDANLTVSGIGRGSGVTGANANDRYNASGWNSAALDANDYFYFTITVSPGYILNLTSFVYTGQISTGTGSFAFRSSLDGYVSDIGTSTATGTTIDLSGAAYQNLTGTITFRLYAWSLSAPGTTFSINNFTFNGTVNCINAPANPSGTITPASNPACDNTTLTYSSPSSTIYWQTSASGTSTTSPTTSNLNVNTTGTYYVRTFDGTCWSTSTVASSSITINASPSITVQPTAPAAVCGSFTGNLSSTATGTSISRQWQYSANGSTGWANVTTNTPNVGVNYTNPATATLNIAGLTQSGYYRMVATSGVGCTSAISDPVLVTVNAIPATPTGNITPAANPACTNTSLSYSGASASIYWQTTSTGESTTTNTTSNFNVNSSGTYYVRAYSGSCWSTASLASPAITINTAPTITTNPTSPAAVCGSFTGNLTASASASGVWEYSADGTNGWSPISANNPSGVTYSSAVTSPLTITGLTQTGYYRYVASVAGCPSAISSTATVTVNPASSVVLANTATTITSNGFTANWNTVADATGYYVDVYKLSTVTSTLSEGFNGSASVITAPAGWTFTNIGDRYTTSGNFGTSSPSLGMDATNDRILTKTISGPATSLSFWIKGQVTNASSKLLVEGFNGTSWVIIEDIFPLPTSGTIKTYTPTSTPPLPANLIQFRFTYTKSAGNLSIDDININYTETVLTYAADNENVFTTDNFLNITGLDPNTTYFYRVRSDRNGCSSLNSNAVPVTTAAPCVSTASIASFNPTSALPGATVTITGSGFTGATAVTFGNVPAISFTIVNDNTITAVVPTLAATGVIRVTVGGCPAASSAVFSVLQNFTQDIRIITQFVNPCGPDANNEFIIAQTNNSSVNIANLGLTSADGSNINWYWRGTNLPSNPYPTFSSGTAEACGTAGKLQCFRFLDPANAADNTVINNVIASLNTIAGCSVFKAVPSTGEIPPASNVIFFLGAGGCGFSSPALNLNFSNHCSGSTPLTQYYVVVGNGNVNCGSGGYFSNSEARSSTLFELNGGSNTNLANYQSQTSSYTVPPSVPFDGQQAAVFVPDGRGGSRWVSDLGCVPPTNALLSSFNFTLQASKVSRGIQVRWTFQAKESLKEFIVERSTDNRYFTKLASIPAAFYLSESEIRLDYTDIENLSNTKTVFYRVRAVSNEGVNYFSPVREWRIHQKLLQLQIFPNPALNDVFLHSSVNETVSYDILSTNGSKVLSGVLRNQTRRVAVGNLSRGLYIIRFYGSDGNLLQSEKFLKD
jgi:hypothetical protein